ncbi:MAG: hypothetical protein ACK4IS_10020 [Erythrobacter sp.]
MSIHSLFSLAACTLAVAAPATTLRAEPPAAATDQTVSVIVSGEAPAKPAAPGKITDPKHPDFVRCRSEAVLNSRAQRVRVCRTNKEWAAAAREGNRQTQELLGMGRPTQPTP